MRVAYIGNFKPEWSTENDIRKAFEFLGWEVKMLQEDMVTWQSVRYEALQSDLLLWTSTWDDAQPFYESVETIRLLGLAGIPSATIHLDVFHGSDRGSRNWKMNPMFTTSHVFTASGDYEKEWKLMGINHHWLPPAVRNTAAHFGKFREEYSCDVAFVGSNGIGYHPEAWPYRKELLDNLRAICNRNGWSFKNPGGDQPKIDRNEEMNDFYASAKVTVGDSLCLLKEDSKYWSDRVPEALGRGGILIMPQINELRKIYSENALPMYEWGNWEQLEDMLSIEVNHVAPLAVIATVGQKQTAKEHTYINRVETILKEVGITNV